MYQHSGLNWWKINVIGSEDEISSWLRTARREGHRLTETVDDEGRPVTVVLIIAPGQLAQIANLLTEARLCGSLEPLM